MRTYQKKADRDDKLKDHTDDSRQDKGARDRRDDAGQGPHVVAQRARLNRLGAIQQPGEAAALKPNRTGLPEALKSGIERLSGMSMDHVRVRYNSDKPAQMNAHAYTQGSNIEVAPGQEHHLPHEGWHVVQQMRGGVAPRVQAKGIPVNDDPALEHEADVMGARALRMKTGDDDAPAHGGARAGDAGVVQLKGVAGTKIGFDKRLVVPDQLKIDEGMVILRAAWREATGQRHTEKGRIAKKMAKFNPVIAGGNLGAIAAFEEGMDRKRRPALYQNKDLAQANLTAANNQVTTLRDQMFRNNHSMAILGALTDYSAIGARTPVTGPLIATALRTIRADPNMQHLEQQVNQMRILHTQAENAIQQDQVVRPMSHGLTQAYYDRLVTDIAEERDLLTQTQAFLDGRLSLQNNEITYHHPSGPVVICDLLEGAAAFAAVPDDGSPRPPREVFRKRGMEDLAVEGGDAKEYVKDSRNTLTRRYAYVEKNYYQMMEFFMVGHMTGRFQQYMMASGNRRPGVHTFTTQMIRNVPTAPQAAMTDTQVAVAHQMYGSLPEQRGVSLTSTPKVGVTYANTGGNFRTDSGFKLKIDLARVPPDVLLLNHYAEGGVSDMAPADYSTNQPHKPGAPSYKYKQSATHARELFLEHIRPEWVVEIEHHEKGDYAHVGGKKTVIKEDSATNLLDAAMQAFGGKSFEAGFEAGLNARAEKDGLKADPDYIKGKATGGLVARGYGKGVEVRGRLGLATAMTAFKETVESNDARGEMSAWHVGYLQARTGQPMVSSSLELRILMNTTREYAEGPTGGGTVMLARDGTRLAIRLSTPQALALGGFKTRVIHIPLESLRGATVKQGKDKSGRTETTIETRSQDYAFTVATPQAPAFLASLQQYISEHARQLTLGSVAAGGRHEVFLDAGKLKLDMQGRTNLGLLKQKRNHIDLATIREVDFDNVPGKVQVSINHAAGGYEMTVTRPEAEKLRALLLANGLTERVVKAIPKPD